MPERIQYKRGVKLPEGAVYVGRPTDYGNPYTGPTREAAVAQFREDWEMALRRSTMTDDQMRHVPFEEQVFARNVVVLLAEIRGKDLACWCRLTDSPCHADVLLELANKETPCPST